MAIHARIDHRCVVMFVLCMVGPVAAQDVQSRMPVTQCDICHQGQRVPGREPK